MCSYFIQTSTCKYKERCLNLTGYSNALVFRAMILSMLTLNSLNKKPVMMVSE